MGMITDSQSQKQINFLAAKIREELNIEDFAADYLEMQGNSYCCPICGKGRDHFFLDATKGSWNCFSGSCDAKGGGVVELAKAATGIDDEVELFNKLVVEYRLPYQTIGDYQPKSETPEQRAEREARRQQTQERREAAAAQEAEERARKAQKAHERIAESQREPYMAWQYLEGRGISESVCRAFNVGYIESEYVGKDASDNPMFSEVCLIPTSETGYTARNIGETGQRVVHRGISHPFNLDALLSESRTVFITEGEIDALSIEEVGGNAIGLCSAAYVGIFDRALRDFKATHGKEIKRKTVFVILDNDDAGRKAAEQVKEIIASVFPNFNVIKKDLPNNVKDPNEALTTNRFIFKNFIDACKEEGNAMPEVDTQQDQNKLRLVDTCQVARNIAYRKDFLQPTPTGFPTLDFYFNDGLLPQSLYVLNAASSLGKTTLMLQMADQIAASGTDVLFVTIEQRANELVRKSLSRILRKYDYAGRDREPITGTDLAIPRYRENAEREAVTMLAHDEYVSTIAPKLHFLEAPLGRPSLEGVELQAQRLADENGKAPIIFVDYLQLLELPLDKNKKQITDERLGVEQNMTTLRQMTSKDKLNTSIFITSAIARGKDTGEAGISAGKGAGGIEYSADVLVGLEPKKEEADKASGSNAEGKKVENARDRARGSRNREMELFISKNRSGRTTNRNKPICFKYDAWTNFWEEDYNGIANREAAKRIESWQKKATSPTSTSPTLQL
jgi:replicative DNA helicase